MLIALCCIALPCQSGEPISPGEHEGSGSSVHFGQTAWIIKPGMQLEKMLLKEDSSRRKRNLGDLYEEVKSDGNFEEPQSSRMGNLFGLQVCNYYLIGKKGDSTWGVSDGFGKKLFDFEVFYSKDQVCARQIVMEKFMNQIQRMPHEHRNRFTYRTGKDNIQMLVRKDGRLKRPYIASKDGFTLIFSLWYDMTDDEMLRVTDEILAVLTQSRKCVFFPQRARRAQYLASLTNDERKNMIRDWGNIEKGMSGSMACELYDHSEEVMKCLNVNDASNAAEKWNETIIPNVNKGVGTVQWLHKHMGIPFEPNEASKETHLSGVTGKFLVKKQDRKYPVEYMIAHMNTREDALKVLFAMRARNEVNVRRKEEDVKRVAANTQLHPGLVGDYDLCLKPVLNGLGVPIPEAEHSTICFVRGNTAVMLKNPDMKVSVLPLARKIDEALKKSIKDYDTPEEVR